MRAKESKDFASVLYYAPPTSIFYILFLILQPKYEIVMYVSNYKVDTVM